MTPDPAGLDKLLLAAGKGIARYCEAAIQRNFGQSVQLWDGNDGLGAVLEEHLKAAGVPNKRLPEIVTPRAVMDALRPYYPNGVKRTKEDRERSRRQRVRRLKR